MHLGIEESFLYNVYNEHPDSVKGQRVSPALLKRLDDEQYWSDVNTLSFYAFVLFLLSSI